MVQENLTGIRVVKSFVREEHEEEKFAKRNNALKDSSMRAFGMVVINMPVMMLIIYSTIIAVMWFGGKMVYAGTLPVGDLTAFFTYITQILISLMMVSMMFMMMTRSIACARRIVEVLDEKPAITDDAAKADAAVQDGSIDFDHVSFKYNDQSPEWILKDVNLHIPSGATVGILGGTGSGKTTLVSLIPRLYEAQEGTVSVGGRPVADYTMEHLRGIRQRGAAKEHAVFRHYPGKPPLGRSQRHGGAALEKPAGPPAPMNFWSGCRTGWIRIWGREA